MKKVFSFFKMKNRNSVMEKRLARKRRIALSLFKGFSLAAKTCIATFFETKNINDHDSRCYGVEFLSCRAKRMREKVLVYNIMCCVYS
jgi:hypothetical protein